MDFTEIPDEGDEFQQAPLKKRPSCLLGLFRLFLLLLVPLAVVVALLPTLLSSDPARKWALSKINAALDPAQLTIDQWSLGWFTSPVLEKVGYVDEAHGANVQIDEVAFDRGLLRLLPIGTLNLGRVTLKHPVAAVSLVPPPQPPPQEGEKPAEKKGGFFFLPVVDAAVSLNVENGTVQVTGRTPQPFTAEQLNAAIDFVSYRKPIGVQTQMKVGGGTLTLEGCVQSLKDLFKGETFEEPQKMTLKLVGVDLTAFGPLIQYASGEPWIQSGVAEGALTAVVSGADQFKVDGGLLVSGLSVAAGSQPPSPKGDLALMLDAGYDKKVVSINKFELSSPWLRANAKGTLQPGAKAGVMTGAISAQAESDLAAVTRDFAPVLGLSKGFSMQRGKLLAKAEIKGDEAALNVDANLTTADLAMTIDGEPLVLKPAPSLIFKAKFPYGQWPEVDTFHLKAPFADVYGSGRFDAAVVKGKLDLTLFSRDFKRMLKSAPPMVGAIYLDTSTKRSGDRVAVNALLKLSDVAAELNPGQRLVVPQGTLKASGCVPLKDNKPENEIQDASFELTLESGKLSGGWKRLAPPQGDRQLVLRGFTLTSNMELGSVRRLAGGFLPASAQQHMTEWQGSVIANATAEAAGGELQARMNAAGQQIVAGIGNGVWHIPDVRLESTLSQKSPQEGVRIEATGTGCAALEQDGSTVFAEKGASLALDALFAPDHASVHVAKLEFTSSLFDLQAKADATELSTRCVVEAQGKAAVDFGEVTQLLESKGIDEFKLTGRASREFHFASPVAGGLATVLAEGDFTGAAFVGSLKGLGLDAGASDATFKLAKGTLKTAYEPALNEGKLRLDPELSVERGTTTLSFPPQTRLLENVKLNQEMVDTLLVNLNPLFQGSKVQDGTVSMDLKLCQLVSGRAPDEGLAVDTSITFKNLKLELGDELYDLLKMLKVKDRVYSAEQLPIHVVVRDGRINVDPIRMVIDKQPVIFSGWVAFDGSIKYLIEVPVTARLVGGTGGKIPKGMTIKIPVAGTVHKPRLDTSVLENALGGLLKNAVGEHAVEKIGTFLEKLQDELKK